MTSRYLHFVAALVGLVAALVGVLSMSAGPTVAQPEEFPRQSIHALAEPAEGDGPAVLRVDGADVAHSKFDVIARVIPPCRRKVYKFVTVGENLLNGSVGRYTAEITLNPDSKPARQAPCHRRLPRSVTNGGVDVEIRGARGRAVFIGARGKQRPNGDFEGRLTVSDQLCDGQYDLIVTFTGSRGLSVYRYRMNLSKALAGRKRVRCPRDPGIG